jgi:hypothetical protein
MENDIALAAIDTSYGVSSGVGVSLVVMHLVKSRLAIYRISEMTCRRSLSQSQEDNYGRVLFRRAQVSILDECTAHSVVSYMLHSPDSQDRKLREMSKY